MFALRIPSAGRDLAALLFTAPSPNGAAVLFIHGWRSSKEGYPARVQPLVDQLGVTCLTFDLGGHGHSTGDLTVLTAEDHLTDAASAYDRLAAVTGVEPGRISVCGASYGADIAIRLSTVRAVRSLVLRAPARPADRPGLDELSDFTGPTLIIESSADEVVSPATIRAHVAAARQPRHEVIDATHALRTPAANAAFVSSLMEWFRTL